MFFGMHHHSYITSECKVDPLKNLDRTLFICGITRKCLVNNQIYRQLKPKASIKRVQIKISAVEKHTDQ